MKEVYLTNWKRELALLLTASFGLITALAWNSVIQKAIKTYLPVEDDFTADIIYAIIVTIILIIAAWIIARYLLS